MFSSPLRLTFVALVMTIGTIQVAQGDSSGWFLLVAGALLTHGYFRYGTVWLAHRAWRHGDFARTERLLRQIRFPALLSPRDRTFYEFLQGATCRHRDDLTSAQRHLAQAAEGATRTPAERTFFLSQLAEAQLTAGDLSGARKTIDRARALTPPPFVEVLIRELEANFPVA